MIEMCDCRLLERYMLWRGGKGKGLGKTSCLPCVSEWGLDSRASRAVSRDRQIKQWVSGDELMGRWAAVDGLD